MTDTIQKLREALQAISHIDDSTNHAVDASAALDRVGKIARQALALPTADHIPDAGEKVADHLPNAGKMIEPPQQHHRDSKELRSLCQARDEARKQRDLCQAEIAGLNSAVGYLSAMVDEQTRLVQKAVQAMKSLHETAKPDDGPDMNAIIPAAAFHVFVDVHAELMFALKQGSQITTLLSAAPDNNGSALGSCYPETAPPVVERELFERTMMDKFGWERKDFKTDARDFYMDGHTVTAFVGWRARAALSAGDAVDAKRYRWLREQHWSNSDVCCVNKPKQNVRLGGTCPSGYLLDSVIDAAMRKGQL